MRGGRRQIHEACPHRRDLAAGGALGRDSGNATCRLRPTNYSTHHPTAAGAVDTSGMVDAKRFAQSRRATTCLSVTLQQKKRAAMPDWTPAVGSSPSGQSSLSRSVVAYSMP